MLYYTDTESEADSYICRLCNRAFRDPDALGKHCRTARVHADSWCERCKRLFKSPVDLRQHVFNSSAHHVCQFCDDDFRETSAYHSHLASKHDACHLCQRQCTGYYGARLEEVHNICSTCEKECYNPHNLRQVSLPHNRVRNRPCSLDRSTRKSTDPATSSAMAAIGHSLLCPRL